MQIIEVHHRDSSPGHEGEFVHVANVTVPDSYDGAEDWQALEYAWRYTNNIEGSWSRTDLEDNRDANPAGTEVLVPLPVHGGRTYGLRSSSVGDIFIIRRGSDKDAWGDYVAASFGFERCRRTTYADVAEAIRAQEERYAARVEETAA